MRTSRPGAAFPQVVAVVDAHPVLALPPLLSMPGPFGGVTLVAAGENPTVADRVADLLDRLLPKVARSGATAPVPFTALAKAIATAASRGTLLLDVSGASPRAAIEAFRCASLLEGRPRFQLSCFDSRQNRHVVSEVDPANGLSSKVVSSGKPVDIGSGGRVRPQDFLALFGLADLPEDPYPLLSSTAPLPELRAAAQLVLGTYLSKSDSRALVSLRQTLAAARQRERMVDFSLPSSTLPTGVLEACVLLARLGLAHVVDHENGSTVTLSGPPDKNAFFFLGGGWLEIACHEALASALPDREVEINAGIRWFPEAPRPEAEADVLFVHGGNLCIVSCKNDWNDERVFAHLRELRALVAEMGEGFVRPTLVSTRRLTPLEESRALSYEIGTFSGRPLLETLKADLDGASGTFLKALRGRGHGAPAPGRRPNT